MKQDDIIEIVQTDHRAKKNLRRVRVASLVERERYYLIVGVNMRGKNSVEYRLPKEPLTEMPTTPGVTGWFTFQTCEVE